MKMKADLIIENGYIVTVDADDNVYPLGSIAVIDNKIAAIGHSEEIEAVYVADKTIDAMGKLVMPGLINAHTHASMTIFRGMADDMPLQEWLNDYIFPAEAKYINNESVRLGAQLAIMEMLRSGTTCFADMYYHENEVATACHQFGIKALLAEGVLDFPVPNSPSPDHGLEFSEKLINRYKNDPLIKMAVGPHSPYTCSKEVLLKCRDLANRYDIPMHIHLSETAHEYDQCLELHKKSPVEYLADLGILEGKTHAAHCVYITEHDIELMKKFGTSAAHNPLCNMKLVSGIAPIPAMLEKGICIGLGTDGVVSNNSLDQFEEMKTASLLAKINTGNPTALDARKVLRMATIESARSLSIEHETGSLEEGKSADMVLADLNKPHLMPLYNIYSHIAYALRGDDVETVIVNGKIVMENRQFSQVDEYSIYAQIQELANTIAEGK